MLVFKPASIPCHWQQWAGTVIEITNNQLPQTVGQKASKKMKITDNLTPEQELALATNLINSGDEMVETYEDLDIRTTHFRGNSTIWINDYFAENWVWSDLDLTEFESLKELISYYCDDITGVPACQRDELVEILIGKFEGVISCDEWI